ncbi:ATP-dependent metalloprotease, partial [Tremellales sp. Uapishka_1]
MGFASIVSSGSADAVPQTATQTLIDDPRSRNWVNRQQTSTETLAPTSTATVTVETTATPSRTTGLSTASKPIPLEGTMGLIMPNPYQSLYVGLTYTFGFVDPVARPAPTIGGYLRQVVPLLILPNYTVDVFPSSGTSDPNNSLAFPAGKNEGLCGATAENTAVGYPFTFDKPGYYMYVVNQTWVQLTVDTATNTCSLPLISETSFFATLIFSLSPLPTTLPSPVAPSSAYTVFADVTTSTPGSLPVDPAPVSTGQKFAIGFGILGAVLGLGHIVGVVLYVRKKRRDEAEVHLFCSSFFFAFSELNPHPLTGIGVLSTAAGGTTGVFGGESSLTHSCRAAAVLLPHILAVGFEIGFRTAWSSGIPGLQRVVLESDEYGSASESIWWRSPGAPHGAGSPTRVLGPIPIGSRCIWVVRYMRVPLWRDNEFLALCQNEKSLEFQSGPPLSTFPFRISPVRVMARPILAFDLARSLGSCRSSRLARPRIGLTATLRPLLHPRSITTTHLSRGIFSSSSSASPAPPSSDLTPFQTQIASLETAAHDSSDPAKHVALMKALLAGGELDGLVRYYENVALVEKGKGNEEVLKSGEAFGIYLEGLGRLARLGEVRERVGKRDALLAGSAIPSASASAATSALLPSKPSSLLSSTTPTTLASTTEPPPLVEGTPTGTPLHPLHVQIAPPTPQTNAWKAVRWLAGMVLWIFVVLTVLSMVMENTGLLKAGPGPTEFTPEEGKVVTFKDVHGVEEAKAELEEVVEFLKNPEKFSNLGGKLPKGVLLTGPPGTGKTMLARAVAGEADVPFLFASGSSFDEMFVGVGAKRVRELFAAARKKAPAIVFIDELDAIGSKRSAKDQHYMKQTLNQLLVELDGFEQSEGVIIIAATNFPESLDKALTRPGRFDRHVVVGLPDVRGRVAILNHHMGEVQFDVDVDASVIARGCPGMSGADLQNLVNQAAVKASREGSTHVKLKHFEWAKDRILMGAERRSHYVTEESKRSTAYHEGGHALVALHTPGAMPLHKVTIMPRGQALGITFQLPEQDKDSYTRKEYSAMIDVALGGRAAEEMIFGRDDVTSGCSSDLQRATDVATRMIRSYGFSDKVGLVAHGDDDSVYLSSKKKDEIEGEIKGFLESSINRASNLLKTHEDELHKVSSSIRDPERLRLMNHRSKLASALVEYETLSLDEVRTVLQGKKLERVVEDGEVLKGNLEKAGQAKGEVVDGI